MHFYSNFLFHFCSTLPKPIICKYMCFSKLLILNYLLISMGSCNLALGMYFSGFDISEKKKKVSYITRQHLCTLHVPTLPQPKASLTRFCCGANCKVTVFDLRLMLTCTVAIRFKFRYIGFCSFAISFLINIAICETKSSFSVWFCKCEKCKTKKCWLMKKI